MPICEIWFYAGFQSAIRIPQFKAPRPATKYQKTEDRCQKTDKPALNPRVPKAECPMPNTTALHRVISPAPRNPIPVFPRTP